MFEIISFFGTSLYFIVLYPLFIGNVVLGSENRTLQVLTKLTEPFDRRVALAAMVAVVSAMQAAPPPQVTQDESDKMDSSSAEVTNPMVVEEADPTEHMPTNGRWFKSVSVPEPATCLYLRFAHKGKPQLMFFVRLISLLIAINEKKLSKFH